MVTLIKILSEQHSGIDVQDHIDIAFADYEGRESDLSLKEQHEILSEYVKSLEFDLSMNGGFKRPDIYPDNFMDFNMDEEVDDEF